MACLKIENHICLKQGSQTLKLPNYDGKSNQNLLLNEIKISLEPNFIFTHPQHTKNPYYLDPLTNYKEHLDVNSKLVFEVCG